MRFKSAIYIGAFLVLLIIIQHWVYDKKSNRIFKTVDNYIILMLSDTVNLNSLDIQEICSRTKSFLECLQIPFNDPEFIFILL